MNRLSRGFGLALTSLLSLGLVLGAAPVAHADAPPEADQLYLANVFQNQNPSANVLGGLYFEFTQHGGAPSAGITVHVSTFSCGNFLKETTVTFTGSDGIVPVNFSPDGGLDSSENSVNRKVGPSVEYYVDYIHPGFDAYHLESSYSGYSVKRPSCAEINGGGTGGTQCVVKAPATKVGKARIGRTVKVRPPSTNGQCGRASYTWKVAGKTVKNGKSLSIGKGMRGKRVTVKVNLSKGPDRVLRFGRVK